MGATVYAIVLGLYFCSPTNALERQIEIFQAICSLWPQEPVKLYVFDANRDELVNDVFRAQQTQLCSLQAFIVLEPNSTITNADKCQRCKYIQPLESNAQGERLFQTSGDISTITIVPYHVLQSQTVAPKLSSEVYGIDTNGTLYERYQIMGGNVISRVIGSLYGLNFGALPHVWERRKDLGGVTLTGVSMPEGVLSQMRIEADRIVAYSGLVFDIIATLKIELNFSLELSLPPDMEWGVNRENGSWNGIIGQLARGEKDIGIAPLSIQLERSQVVDFTSSFFEDKYTLVIRKTENDIPTHNNPWFLIRAFTQDSWICVAASLLILVIANSLLNTNGPNFIDSSAFVLLSLLQRGSPSNSTPGQVSARILWLFTALSLSQVYMAFSADVMAGSTAKKDVGYPKTFSEAVDQGYNILTGTGSSLSYLRDAPVDSGRRKAYDETISADDMLENYPADGIKRVQQGTMQAVFMGAGLAQGYSDLRPLLLADAIKDYQAFAVPKGSELLPLLSHHMNKLKQSGILQRLTRKYFPDGIESIRNPTGFSATPVSKSRLEPVCYEKVALVFGALLQGVIVGMTVLLIENCIKRT